MKILAVITARGGSKGIPGKNLALLNNKPLIYYTIQAALNSLELDKVILSTDSNEIANYCSTLGLKSNYTRPPELAKDDTPSLPVITDCVNWLSKVEDYTPDAIMLLQPTSPFRVATDIDESIKAFREANTDSLVSVVKVPHNCIPESVMQIKNDKLVRYLSYDELKNNRNDKPVYYARNGAAIYLFKRSCLLEKKSLYGDSIAPYLMTKESSLDIDDYFDLEICELLMNKRSK